VSKYTFERGGVRIKTLPHEEGEFVFGNICLTGEVDKCCDGFYDSEDEVKKRFKNLLQAVKAYEKEGLKVFRRSNDCQHEHFEIPKYSLRKNIFDYYYHFEKKCSDCGKIVSMTTSADNDPKLTGIFPEGYEGATKTFWNLNI